MTGLFSRLRELLERMVNSRGAKRINFQETAEDPIPAGGEEREVLRGISRQVVVVRSPDPRVFEEAIFIVREDFLTRPDRGRSELLKEARAAADRYVTATLGRHAPRPFRLPAALYAACAAGGAAVAWIILTFV